MTKHWALQDAKARLSELVRAAGKEAQHITLRGEPAAVVISEEEYRRLCKANPDRTFYEIWNSAPRVKNFKIPRRKGRMRPVNF
jgi:prevent-host-death family protein